MDFVSWVFAPAHYDEDKPLLIDAANPGRSLSMRQLRTKVRQLVAGLKAVGIQPGDCVCVNSFNDILYNVLYLGIIGAGARFTGVNPAYSAHEITHHMTMTKVKALIVEPQMLETALVSADECGIPRSMVFVFDVHAPNVRADLQTWSTLLEHGESDFVRGGDPATTIASYQTSSGTSGLPKAAMIPHAYLISQAKLRISEPSIDYKVRRLTALPPMHVFATPIVPASIRQGCEVYIMRRYEMSAFIQAIERYEISETYLPPPPLIAIPKSPLATKQAMKSIRQIWMGGAGVTYPNQLPMYNVLHPDARVNQCWGMTEVGWVTTIKYPHKQQDDSVGTPLHGYAIRIVDDDGKIITKPGVRGEVQILAPHPMLGYLNNPEANASAFTVDSKGRWVNSGDIAHVNERGNLFIVDRKKDLVKVRGWQVSPAEVEARLIQHPDIIDAGVIGLPLPNSMGDVVRAYVVVQDGSLVTESEIKAFAALELSRYKCPEEIVFTDVIPKNPTGKILRRILRDRALGDKLKLEAITSAATSVISLDRCEPTKVEHGYPYNKADRKSKDRSCIPGFASLFAKMFDCSTRRE